MGIMQYNYRSQCLSANVNITIVYPTDRLSYYDMTVPRHHGSRVKLEDRYLPGMKFQTIYLLHGGGDDDSVVYRYINSEAYAEANQVMLVTPSIVNSFGVDTKYGLFSYTFLTEELPVVIQSLFASSPKREDNFIMGFAMGGNAALGAALRRPDLYAACVDLSGGIGLTLDMDDLKKNLRSSKFRIYPSSFENPDTIDGTEFDMYSVAKGNIERGVELPKFFLCAGSEEGQIGVRVHNDAIKLKELGYDVYYEEAAGYKHDFPIWNKYIKLAMDEWLPLKRHPLYV